MTLATCCANSLTNIETLKSYIQDAENEGDQEFVELFDRSWRITIGQPSVQRRYSCPYCRASKSSSLPDAAIGLVGGQNSSESSVPLQYVAS
jgi:hypothetical protein